MKKVMISLVGMVLLTTTTWAQGGDNNRMERDIEVAENVLGTLVKQQFDKNLLMPIEVEGTYRSGFGVTLSVPNFSNFPMNFLVVPRAPRTPRVKVYGGEGRGYSYKITTDEDGEVATEEIVGEDEELREKETERAMRDAERELEDTHRDTDVTVSRSGFDSKDAKEHNKYLIEAAKTFITDYNTILSQLKPEERIIISNRGNDGGNRYWRFMGDEKRYFLSVEASGADIKQYQSGKLTKDQFVGKIKVVESEVEPERSQDLELLTSIFDRLYQPDLSKTFYMGDDTYYERLKDYGAVFYMQVYSSNQLDRGFYNMPTLKLDKVSEEERNKKVTELYPEFEKELKENILEYGRTVKSLKPDEVLVFNVRITKCKSCGIPSTLEITTKASVLSDYMAGKIDKNVALAKLEVKKGTPQ